MIEQPSMQTNLFLSNKTPEFIPNVEKCQIPVFVPQTKVEFTPLSTKAVNFMPVPAKID